LELSRFKKYTFSQIEQDKIKFAIEQNKVNIGNIALLSFALGKSYEQNKTFNSAFESLVNVNNIIAKYRPFKTQLLII
jgi:hypothetical protein